MPLSEHEQRQLEAIERALYADDPKFASAVRYTDPKVHGRRRIILGAALIIVGLVVLLVGVVASVWEVGVAGFVIMLFGATRAIAGVRRVAGGRLGPATPPPAPNVTPFRRQRGQRGQGGQRRSRGLSGSGPNRSSRPTGAPRQSPMAWLEERWRRRPEAGPRE